MKKIMAALVLVTMIHFGAEARTNGCKTRAHKHKALTHSNTGGMQGLATVTESCRIVPYEVCKINPDRRSVSCYKTEDPYAEDPIYYDAAMTYGPNGKMPGERSKSNVRTIVVNPPAPPDYCKRNEANNTTICYTPGELSRDEFGFYHYNFDK